MAYEEQAPRIRCRHRLPGPELAGHTTWESLKEAARKHPDLRPCPRLKGKSGAWWWIYRKNCETCPDAVAVAEPARLTDSDSDSVG